MVVLIVELVSLEGVVGVEAVGTCEELWSWSHLTTATDNRKTLLLRKQQKQQQQRFRQPLVLLTQHQTVRLDGRV